MSILKTLFDLLGATTLWPMLTQHFYKSFSRNGLEVYLQNHQIWSCWDDRLEVDGGDHRETGQAVPTSSPKVVKREQNMNKSRARPSILRRTSTSCLCFHTSQHHSTAALCGYWREYYSAIERWSPRDDSYFVSNNFPYSDSFPTWDYRSCHSLHPIIGYKATWLWPISDHSHARNGILRLSQCIEA